MDHQQTIIQAEAVQFSALFMRGQFAVPWHQRNYDWHVRNVQAALRDIEEAVQYQNECYFLGAIILIQDKVGKWQINDGQQRMVTVSLIFAELCRRFSEDIKDSQREAIALRMLFVLGANQPCTLSEANNYQPRIDPPDNDRTHYHQIICGHRIGATSTLTRACREIHTFFSSMKPAQLQEYFDFMIAKLEIACLMLPPQIDPCAIYEVINCRGKPLNDFDRIRNYIYSHFNERTEEHKKRLVHTNLEKIRIMLSASKKELASEYVRCRLQCEFGYLQKEHFYPQVRAALRDQRSADQIHSLVIEISDDADLELFRNITLPNPSPGFIEAFKKSSRTTNSPRNIEVLLRELRGYTVTLPLVFAILRRYIHEPDKSRQRHIARIGNKNLRRLAAFVLRTAFVAPKFEPSIFEKKFSGYLREIMTATDIPNAEFAAFLMGCDREAYGVLDNTMFEQAIAKVRMTGARKIKQFLLGVNQEQHGAQLLDERLCDIEHILPKSPDHWNGWSGFSDEDGSDWVERIGNLTLLSKRDNRPDVHYNRDFASKKEVYKKSGIVLTRQLCRYSEWSPRTITKRQAALAKRAVQVWAFK